jgi:hypothetical protein
MTPYFLVTSLNAVFGCWLGTVLTCAAIRWIVGYTAPLASLKFNFLVPLLFLALGASFSCLLYAGILNSVLLSGAIGFVAGLLVGSLIGKASLPFA